LLKLEQSQAAAAVGQIALAQAWQQALAAHDIVAAQVLLTLTDTEERRRYLNARATLNTLLKTGAVPVINENDTVATSEIRYGDNDRLAARVSSMMGASCLVLLSDVDGLYTAPPGTPGAEFVKLVEDVSADVIAMAGAPVSGMGSGGMVTKIEAARIATGAGAAMVITAGHEDHPLQRILSGGAPPGSPPPPHPRRPASAGSPVRLTPPAAWSSMKARSNALMKGRSLLPAGIKMVHGNFSRGDTVPSLPKPAARSRAAWSLTTPTTQPRSQAESLQRLQDCWVWQAVMKWFTVMIW
jgi:glutamate 5-kinase